MEQRKILTKWLLVLTILTGLVGTALGQIFVDDSATGANNGASWADAYVFLQDALAATSSGEIWVAKGTYKPDQGGGQTLGNRYATFQLKNGVAIYGGFAGIEDPLTFDLADRNFVTNETFLSGDIGTIGDISDNSYTVVTGSGTDDTAVLDGFIITAGNADDTAAPHNSGGGMYNSYGSPKVSNCTFSNNSANNAGGGMWNNYSTPSVINCTFINNSAVIGGGMSNSSSNPTIINCTFSGNSATDFGGGMDSSGSNSLIVTNSILWGNIAGVGPQIALVANNVLSIDHSDLQGGQMGIYDDGTNTINWGAGNIDTNPLFVYPENDNLRLGIYSQCIDAGDNASVPAGVVTDLDGNPRISNDIVDMGAYETPPIPINPPAGLVSWWPGDGNADDISGGNDGILMNGVTFAAGKVDQAFSFDGVDDYIAIPYDSSYNFRLSSFTLQAWVKFTQSSSVLSIISRPLGGNPTSCLTEFRLYSDSGSLGGAVQYVDPYHPPYYNSISTHPLTFADGNWHLCSFVNDIWANEIIIYVDDIVYKSYPGGVAMDMEDNPNGIYIGSYDGSQEFFEGLIDEVAIYDRALTADEIWAIYYTGSAGMYKYETMLPPAGIASWWPGDGNADDIARGNDGILVNGVTFAAGKVDQAFSFDGEDDYIAIPYNSSYNFKLSSFTLQAWVKFTQSNSVLSIISRPLGGNPTDGFSEFSLDSNWGSLRGVVQGEYDPPNTTFSISTHPVTFADGNWHLCSFVNDIWANEISIYVDDILYNSYPESSFGGMEHNLNGIFIGSYDGSQGFFEGLIDEVVIYNRALTADEIQAIFLADSGGMYKPTYICSSTTINAPGVYILTQNIISIPFTIMSGLKSMGISG